MTAATDPRQWPNAALPVACARGCAMTRGRHQARKPSRWQGGVALTEMHLDRRAWIGYPPTFFWLQPIIRRSSDSARRLETLSHPKLESDSYLQTSQGQVGTYIRIDVRCW